MVTVIVLIGAALFATVFVVAATLNSEDDEWNSTDYHDYHGGE